METEYLSLDNLKEIAEIGLHVQMARSLIDKYRWPAEIRAELERKLLRIVAKEKDPSLNLSVIGEFTTGKSTFINALVRSNLLVSSIMQGTTLANTVIDYCPAHAIGLYHVDGRKAMKKFANLEELKRGIAAVTTREQTARMLKAVRIGLPSRNLQEGMRIIDTPGTNATEKWHEEVTKKALRDISDLSIILVDATRPLPETLLDFIEIHLRGVLHQCAFVVTKLDLIARNERGMMLEYIRRKLESFLDRDDVRVFPYVAPLVIHTFAPGTFEMEEDPELLELSLKSEKDIIEYMGRQKIKAQTQKLLFFLNDLFDLMSKEIEKVRTAYDRELTMLEKSRQIDLSAFVGEQKIKCTAAYREYVRTERQAAVQSFYEQGELAAGKVVEKIARKQSLDNLSDYVNTELTADCENLAQEMINSQKEFLNKPKTCFKQSLKMFQQDFEDHFRDLHVLQVVFNQPTVPAPQSVNTANLKGVSSFIGHELSNENKAFGVGALGGAALGTVICPGVGTVIGLLAGLFVGGQMAPDTEKVKEELLKKIKIPLEAYYHTVAGDLEQMFDNYTCTLEKRVGMEIDRYETQYRTDVEQKIAEQKKRKSGVLQRIKALDNDCREIEMRRRKLSGVSVKITLLKNDIP